MNKKRRKSLESIKTRIDEIRGNVQDLKSELEDLQAEEQDYYDNMPEGLQQGEKGEKAEENANYLQEAIDNLEQSDSELVTAYWNIETATE